MPTAKDLAVYIIKNKEKYEDLETVLDDIFDSAMDIWHDSDSTLDAHTYLGLTWEEYAEWLVDPLRYYAQLETHISNLHKE